MDLRQDYLKRQLIAYLGNKRSLLPFLHTEFLRLSERARVENFLDPFAGSGSVSRLGRAMGFKVFSNDWEDFSFVINSCYLCHSPLELSGLFRGDGGIPRALDALNSLHPERGGRAPERACADPEPFIALHYAPADTGKADYRRERLFYTRENAVFLDRAREAIACGFGGRGIEFEDPRGGILLALLLYEAATHANTSGVFKACHKGFGGHGKDALTRIMAPMELEAPILIGGKNAVVGKEDACAFASRHPVDLAYLDPPYNQHQYGSNYHLLNTIAKWERRPVSSERRPDGMLARKAGIPEEWKSTRSPYCVRSSAPSAFRGLLESIDARFIALSYNTEGIVPFEELCEMLAGRGSLELRSCEYVKYKGGKQSIGREIGNSELLLVVDTKAMARGAEGDAIRSFAFQRELSALARRAFVPERIRALPGWREESGELYLAGGRIVLRFSEGFEISSANRPALLPLGELIKAKDELLPCACADRSEEFDVLLGILAAKGEAASGRRLGKRALSSLRKFAHKKYRELFEAGAAEMERIIMETRGLEPLLRELGDLRELAKRRFEG